MLTPGRLTMLVMGSNIAPLVLAPFRAALLGPGGRGELALVQSWILLVGLAGAMGVRQVLYETVATGRVGTVDYRSGILISLSVSIPCAAILLLLHGDTTEFVWIPFVVAAVGILYAAYQIEVASAQLEGRNGHCLVLLALPTWVDLALSLPALMLGLYNVELALLIMAIVEATRFVATIGVRFARAGVALRMRFSWRRAFAMTPLSLLPAVASQGDVVILGALYEARYIGPYALAKMAYSVTLMPANILEGRVVRSFGMASTAGRWNLWAKATGAMVGLGLAVGSAAALAISQFFNAGFASAVYYTPVLAVAGGAMVIITLASAVAIAHRQTAVARLLIGGQMAGLAAFYFANYFTASILFAAVCNVLILITTATAGVAATRRFDV